MAVEFHGSGCNWATATHVVFKCVGDSPSGKTAIWQVSTAVKDREGNPHPGVPLGQVKWFGKWRKYSFFPLQETLYEETCLRDIADFCQTLTQVKRTGVGTWETNFELVR